MFSPLPRGNGNDASSLEAHLESLKTIGGLDLEI
jgi:hypothetical protein